MVLALLLLSHTFAFDAGCALPGESGGRCKRYGCSTYCDNGLTCDALSNTCVGGDLPSLSSPETCTNASLNECPEGQLAFACQGSATPPAGPFTPSSCQQVGPSGSDILYCCVTTWSGPLPAPILEIDGSVGGSGMRSTCCEGGEGGEGHDGATGDSADADGADVVSEAQTEGGD
jgi:hypothetical protein